MVGWFGLKNGWLVLFGTCLVWVTVALVEFRFGLGPCRCVPSKRPRVPKRSAWSSQVVRPHGMARPTSRKPGFALFAFFFLNIFFTFGLVCVFLFVFYMECVFVLGFLLLG